MNLTNRLIPALVLAGALATTSGQAEELKDQEAYAAQRANASEQSIERAKEANEDAAKQAVEAVLTSTQLDLDIRLVGPTSKKIAGDR